MKAFYGKEPALERKRNAFYMNMASVYGLEGWNVRRKVSGFKVTEKKNIKKDYNKAIGKIIDTSTEVLAFFSEYPKFLKDIENGNEMGRRLGIAIILTNKLKGREITNLQSVDFLNSEVSGGFGPKVIGDYKIDCMNVLTNWKENMPANVWQILERCFWHNEFVFLTKKKQRINKKNMDLIKLGLDIIAYEECQLKKPQLVERWPIYEQWLSAKEVQTS